jgi:hypothetical protein
MRPKRSFTREPHDCRNIPITQATRPETGSKPSERGRIGMKDRRVNGIVALVTIVASNLWAWILGLRMRGRIQRALGKDAKTEMELTSLNTWINVEDEEERRLGGRLR